MEYVEYIYMLYSICGAPVQTQNLQKPIFVQYLLFNFLSSTILCLQLKAQVILSLCTVVDIIYKQI